METVSGHGRTADVEGRLRGRMPFGHGILARRFGDAPRLSLRWRGVVALVAVALYIVVAALALDRERQQLHALSLELEQLHDKDAILGRTTQAVLRSLARARELASTGELRGSAADDLALDLELVHSGLGAMARYAPAVAPDIRDVEQLIERLRWQPAPELVAAVDLLEDNLDKRLSVIDRELHEMRGDVWTRYHHAYDRMTLVGVMVNLVGVLVFGALVTLFFSRLTWDIVKAKDRATAIVGGYRGQALAVSRRDEVGDLMEGINRMQVELREREQKLEIARERHFHREKMAAMGSLAAAVAHEINNPMAAIAGIAQAMAAATKAGRAAESSAMRDGPALILEQAQRVTAISRQIAEFTRPPAERPAMMDLNATISSTCRFAQYDRRLRNVSIELTLDKALPAVLAVADHLTQVLMNLLLNAADALVDVTGRKPTIRITTALDGTDVLMVVSDNGRGMDAATLARAFEESFTTKPVGTGRGLGLFLCRALLQRGGGRIDLESTPGVGTTVTVRCPLRAVTPPEEANASPDH